MCSRNVSPCKTLGWLGYPRIIRCIRQRSCDLAVGGGSQSLLQNTTDDFFGIEKRFRQRAPRAALPIVIRLDERNHPHRFINIAEAKKSLCIGQKPARPGMLNDGGFATGEIANCPVANPGIL